MHLDPVTHRCSSDTVGIDMHDAKPTTELLSTAYCFDIGAFRLIEGIAPDSHVATVRSGLLFRPMSGITDLAPVDSVTIATLLDLTTHEPFSDIHARSIAIVAFNIKSLTIEISASLYLQ
jgi:hypothetical protein